MKGVCCGGKHTILVAEKGEGDHHVFAFGYNACGQLGQSHRRDCTTPVRLKEGLPVGDEIMHIAAGAHHTVIAAEDEVFSCGENGSGQLGLGHYKVRFNLIN